MLFVDLLLLSCVLIHSEKYKDSSSEYGDHWLALRFDWQRYSNYSFLS